MLRRFLRARNLDVGKASSMFLKYLKWRSEAVPNGYISEAQIKNQLAEKKMFVQGFDKKGRPIGVVFGSKHMYYKRDMEEFKRMVFFFFFPIYDEEPANPLMVDHWNNSKYCISKKAPNSWKWGPPAHC